jgi:hypothetical protein
VIEHTNLLNKLIFSKKTFGVTECAAIFASLLEVRAKKIENGEVGEWLKPPVC